MQPKISIILRTRQSQDNLGQCLESILGQTLRDFELIIINDFESKANLAEIEKYPDPRVVVFGQKEVLLGRNFGVEKASGEYLAFVDADDYWLPKKLELQLGMLQDTGVDVCYGWTDLVDDKGALVRHGSRSTAGGNVYGELVLNNFLDCRSNALIRKSLLTRTGGFDDTMKIAEDWDLYLRLAKTGLYACMPEVLTFYRLTPEEMASPVTAFDMSIQEMANRLFSLEDKSMVSYQNLILGSWNKRLLNLALEEVREGSVILAVKSLINAVKYDPNLWRQRMLWRAIVKISHMILPQPVQLFLFQRIALFQKVELLAANISPILRSMQDLRAESS